MLIQNMLDLFQERKEIVNSVELPIRFRDDVLEKKMNFRHLTKDGSQMGSCMTRKTSIRQDQHFSEVMEKQLNLLIMKLSMRNGAQLTGKHILNQMIDPNQTPHKMHPLKPWNLTKT